MSAPATLPFDSLLLLTYGGPETPDEVVPFVRSVLGPRATDDRVIAAARKYDFLEGVSPINEQSRALLVRLINQMNAAAPDVPVYWATLHSHPTLEEAFFQMAAGRLHNAAIFVPAPLESALMHKKYLQSINDALDKYTQSVSAGAVSAGSVSSESALPELTFLKSFAQEPLFLSAMQATIEKGLASLRTKTNQPIHVVFSAHSLPTDCFDSRVYDDQYDQTVRILVQRIGLTSWSRAYQSASPNTPMEWLGPETGDAIWSQRNQSPKPAILLVPFGFALDNMEVAFDLDYQMGVLCENLDMPLYRAPTVASEPDFVQLIVQQVLNHAGTSLK